MSTLIKVLAPTVTGDTAAYATGDNVGGKLTLTRMAKSAGGSGQILSARIVSDSVQTATFDIVFFNADPSGSTFTNNGAQDIVAADQAKVIGVLHLDNVSALSGASVHQSNQTPLDFVLSSGTTGYAAIVVRGTPTLAANGDLSLLIRVWSD